MASVKKQTVLCVDDDKQNLELLEALLSLEGYAMKFFDSGESALAHIDREVPDLILLDIMMPGMTGFEVLERLRADGRTKSIPVVLVTAQRSEEERVRGLKIGCDDFITKPFDLIELRARVRSLLRLSRYQKSMDDKEESWHVIHEMKEPLILCKPNWVITNFNAAARPYLMPGAELENLNFLNLIFKNYSISHSWDEMKDCSKAPSKFEITRKDPGPSGEQRLEVSLEVLGDPNDEVVSIVLMLWDVTKEKRKKKKARGFFSFPSFGKK